MIAEGEVLAAELIEARCRPGDLLRVDVRGDVGQGQVASGRHGVHQFRHDLIRIVVVSDRVQDRDQHDRHRPREVQRPRRLLQDRVSIAQIGVQVVDQALVAAGQQDPRVGEHDRVIIHVDHARLRRRRLSDLVRVVRGRDAGAEIKELPDARAGGQLAHRPGQKLPVSPRARDHPRVGGGRFLGRLPVGGKVVRAAQPVIVDPGLVRDADIKGGPTA
jgi:hypothetical protein